MAAILSRPQCIKDMDRIDWYLTTTKQYKAHVLSKLFGKIAFKQETAIKELVCSKGLYQIK